MKVGDFSKDELLRESVQDIWRIHRNHLDFVESRITEETNRLQTALDGIANDFDNPEEAAVYQENYLNFHEEFYRGLSIFANSFFVTSHSVFEYQLIRMCHRSMDMHTFPDPICERPDLDDVKNYLTRVGVGFPFGGEPGSNLWHKITRYNDIRNQIVHNDGLVSHECHFFKYVVEQGVVEGISNWCEVESGFIEVCNKRFRLSLKRNFCKDAADTFEQCIMKIIEIDPTPS